MIISNGLKNNPVKELINLKNLHGLYQKQTRSTQRKNGF